jgi:hypothetical protein
MTIPDDITGLTALFRRLGAADPQAWATSQVNEGIPQLARFLFLRQAWLHVVPEDDSGWINHAIESALNNPDQPYAGAGHALTRLRARGATDAEVTDLVRAMQAQLLFSLCCLLEDPAVDEGEASEVMWTLVQTDIDGNVVGPINGLHESVLETDPTGREMRPRQAAD